jgi:hypothetical protein
VENTLILKKIHRNIGWLEGIVDMEIPLSRVTPGREDVYSYGGVNFCERNNTVFEIIEIIARDRIEDFKNGKNYFSRVNR